MTNQIRLKRGSGSNPSASDLAVGELAVRTDTGVLFTKDDGGSVITLGGGGGISDGDKGDITVSNNGDTFTIDNGVINNAKVASNAAIAVSKLSGVMPLAGGTFSGNVAFGDNVTAFFGASSDLRILHGGTNSTIRNITGQLQLRSDTITFENNDGSDFATVTGIKFGDNNKARFGAGNDFQIYHDSSATANIILANSGTINIRMNSSENAIVARQNAEVELFFNNNLKLETTNTGIDVTGNIAVSGTVDGRDLASDGSKLDGIESGATADQSASEILTLIKTVDGSGSGLDADLLDGQEGSYYRNASNINAGTISDARLPSSISSDITGNAATATTSTRVTVTDQSSDTSCSVLFTQAATGNQTPHSGSNLTFNSSSGLLTATSFSGNGASLTSLNASNISSGTIAAARVATLNQNTTGSSASCTGNSATATQLQNARTIAGTSFNGTANISINYNNLTNKPTIPTNNNQLTNGAGYITSASFSDVAGGGTFTGDISVSGGAAALNVNANSDIRFTNGNWTGNATKIQHHSNFLYIVGGSSGIIFREGGTDRAIIDGNGHFRPGQNNTYDLGTSSLKWRNVYTNDLHLSNEGHKNKVDNTWGNYTIQEGENDLFLLNNRNGKMYKFMLQEVK